MARQQAMYEDAQSPTISVKIELFEQRLCSRSIYTVHCQSRAERARRDGAIRFQALPPRGRAARRHVVGGGKLITRALG